jgi:uncharacterized Zn-binding protein involved in type VI secretion
VIPAAARVFDSTTHGGVIIGPGVPTVIIGGLWAAVGTAAVPGDLHVCAIPPPPAGPHPPTPIGAGSKTVFIGGRPAARVGDKTGCGAVIVTGAFNVIIGG